MIDAQVAVPLLSVVLGQKVPNLRVPLPKAYNGEEDIELFDGWLQTLLRWMRMAGYGGFDKDGDRLTILAMFLEEHAKSWYNDTIDGQRHKYYDIIWTFKKAVTGLYDRFIHEASIVDATMKFYSIRYNAEKGVMGFYHELNRYSTRMVREPDSYTFKTQIMLGLPTAIMRHLVTKGVTAEKVSVSNILK